MLLLSRLLGILAGRRLRLGRARRDALHRPALPVPDALERGGFGGGDIKLIGAASFCLGMLASAYALVFSLSAAAYMSAADAVGQNEGQAVALALFCRQAIVCCIFRNEC